MILKNKIITNIISYLFIIYINFNIIKNLNGMKISYSYPTHYAMHCPIYYIYIYIYIYIFK